MAQNNEEEKYRSPTRIHHTAIHIIGWMFIGVVFAGLFALAFGFVVKWIWNMLMPGLFGLNEISFWQAFGLVLLAKLLFGGFGPHRHDTRRGNHRFFEKRMPWPRPSGDRRTFSDKYQDWKEYHAFWNEEGQASFDAYLARKNKKTFGTDDSGPMPGNPAAGE